MAPRKLLVTSCLSWYLPGGPSAAAVTVPGPPWPPRGNVSTWDPPREAGDSLGTLWGHQVGSLRGAGEEESPRVAAAPRERGWHGVGGLLDGDTARRWQHPPSSRSSPRDLKAQDAAATARPPQGCTDPAGAEPPLPRGGHLSRSPSEPGATRGPEATAGRAGDAVLADAANAEGCAPRPLPGGPPDTARAAHRDEPGRGPWSSGAGCGQAGQRDGGMRGAGRAGCRGRGKGRGETGASQGGLKRAARNLGLLRPPARPRRGLGLEPQPAARGAAGRCWGAPAPRRGLAVGAKPPKGRQPPDITPW